MTLILGDLAKRSHFDPNLDVKKQVKQMYQDLQRLYIALQPSLVVTLTDEATIATDASIAFDFRVTLAGNRTLGNPTNGRDGQKIKWAITQDTIGSRTLAFGSDFSFSTDLPESAVVMSTDANTTDLLLAEYDSVNSKWRVIAFIKGFT